MRPVAAVDTETEIIKQRPEYPPKPVGVAITEPGRKRKYWAFGHPCENNCTKLQARREVQRVYNQYQVVYHNAKFDMDVLETHMDLPFPKYGFHDTEFLAFLHNPHEPTLALKPLAEKYLSMPPEERDRLAEWIQEHVFLSKAFKYGDYEVCIEASKPKGWYKVPPTKIGAFISYAPGKLVGTYAIGDTDRTLGLFKYYYKQIVDAGMLEAYERELKLLPILLANEREGVCVAHDRLRSDVAKWQQWVEIVDIFLRKKLKAAELDVDSNEELADALENANLIDNWIYTENGNRSTSKENIEKCIKDTSVSHVLNYRSRLVNSYRNFGRPWLAMADATGGRIQTYWNQVRSADARGKSKGARTGRLSSQPNFQNVSNTPATVVATQRELKKLELQKKEGIILPKALRDKVGQLPALRDYIVPDNSKSVILRRDFMNQELRILAHFEDGLLLEAYQKDPYLNIHLYIQNYVNNLLGTHYDKLIIKPIVFGMIYGEGAGGLATRLNVQVEDTIRIKKAIFEVLPGLETLDKSLKTRGKNNDPIRTWGGRVYYVEPPKIVKGRMRTFEYKLLNVLIQGSAADCTKQAMINYDSVREEGRLLLNVHDELMLSCPAKAAKREMALLRDSMADVAFDVPMLSDGKYSDVSWGQMKPWIDD